MSDATSTFAALRQRLAEEFPQAVRNAGMWRTGVPALDGIAGGLPRGALSEVVCAAPSCGGQLLLGELLRTAREQGGRVALIDAHDSFDPQSWSQAVLDTLVWVRCRGVGEAMQVADVMVRDANLALVLLDLRLAAGQELRRVPASTWYRLQRAVETTGMALVVTTPCTAVASTQLRVMLGKSHALSAMEVSRSRTTGELAPVVQRQRMQRWSAAG